AQNPVKETDMENRAVGVVAVIIKKRSESAAAVNDLLTRFGHIIIGRMGLPYQERDLNIITLIVDASSDEIGALTGKLGMIDGVTAKSTVAKLN
ncbi:MAG TPA: iron-only hydrogenase system regulator, partial [Treponemataceae bacterium]|nr:iron-only hydrogenase system regulator [Treponemataceae bacterium]